MKKTNGAITFRSHIFMVQMCPKQYAAKFQECEGKAFVQVPEPVSRILKSQRHHNTFRS